MIVELLYLFISQTSFITPFFSGDYLSLCGSQPGQIVDPITGRAREIDECALMPQACQNGICMNTPGSFKCDCNRGFAEDPEFSSMHW